MARPVSPISAMSLALLNLVADCDQVLGVVRVARGVAIAVIDLDHDAVAVAISRPGNDAIGNRDTYFMRPCLPAKSMPV